MLLVIHSFNIVDELSGAWMADGVVLRLSNFRVLRIRYTVLYYYAMVWCRTVFTVSRTSSSKLHMIIII